MNSSAGKFCTRLRVQAVSDSHMKLYAERRNLLALQKANDELRLSSMDQIRQIRALQAHCQLQNCRHPDCGADKQFRAEARKSLADPPTARDSMKAQINKGRHPKDCLS